MDNVGVIELLDELNPLTKNDMGCAEIPLDGGHKITKASFITENYFITFFSLDDPLALASIIKVYEIMQLSIPNFLKVINIRNSVIVATPKYNNSYENANYSIMMDELARFTTYCFKRTGDVIMSSIMLKEYVEMYVIYPPKVEK